MGVTYLGVGFVQNLEFGYGCKPTLIISNNFTLGLSEKNLKSIMKKLLFSSVLVLMMSVTFFSCSSDSNSPTPVPCSQGYTGINCSTQIQPSKIKITKIRVTSFPNLTPGGNNWDAFAAPGWENPDIFPVLFTDNGTIGLYSGLPKSDVYSNGNDVYDFIPASPIVITDVTKQLTLNLYDEDNGSIEFMGGWNFYPYSSTGGFPTLLNIGFGSGTVKYQLTLTYEW